MKNVAMQIGMVCVILVLLGMVSTAGAGQVPAGPVGMATGGVLGEFTVESVMEFFERGGRTMWFLGFLSIMGLTFVLERLVRLRKRTIVPKGLAEQAKELWKQGRYRDIRALCGDERILDEQGAPEDVRPYPSSSLGRMITFIVRHRKNPIGEMATVLTELGGREMEWHYRRTYPLAVVATLSPLLGLFGTVIGMMGAFKKFRLLGETGDPSVFAGDISVALITTATGLAIAVPALFFYHLVKSRTNRFRETLETEVADLMSSWLLATEED